LQSAASPSEPSKEEATPGPYGSIASIKCHVGYAPKLAGGTAVPQGQVSKASSFFKKKIIVAESISQKRKGKIATLGAVITKSLPGTPGSSLKS
jgi:hypothetical protein